MAKRKPEANRGTVQAERLGYGRTGLFLKRKLMARCIGWYR